MPTQAVERIASQIGTLAPEATLQLWAARREQQRRVSFETRIFDLMRTLATVDAANLDAALAPTLETLGSSLEADRVLFFDATSSPNTFAARGLWNPCGDRLEKLQAAASIDLERLPDQGCGLRAGELQRLAGMPCLGALDGQAASRTHDRWLSVRATLYIPCLSPAGLLGFFAVEGGIAASRWGGRILDRAELVGHQFAALLERRRLSQELSETRMRQSHEERLETLGRVASGVAHDFNNVLTAILGYADLLEMELDEKGDGRRELGEIREAATRAAGLVEQVLGFGRVRQEGIQSVALADCVTDVQGMLERVLGDRIELRLDLEASAAPHAAGAARVRIDRGGFERALLNLASNARAALADVEEDPSFSVSLRKITIDAEGRDTTAVGSAPVLGVRVGEHMRLTARDNGCGIEPALLSKIFEPFYTTKQSSGGTGLGLSTTAEVLRESRGGIRVESAPGEGAVFHLYFPVSEPDATNRPLSAKRGASRKGARLDPRSACV